MIAERTLSCGATHVRASCLSRLTLRAIPREMKDVAAKAARGGFLLLRCFRFEAPASGLPRPTGRGDLSRRFAASLVVLAACRRLCLGDAKKESASPSEVPGLAALPATAGGLPSHTSDLLLQATEILRLCDTSFALHPIEPLRIQRLLTPLFGASRGDMAELVAAPAERPQERLAAGGRQMAIGTATSASTARCIGGGRHDGWELKHARACAAQASTS
mmetsp:Transcript_23896/g.66968  ORF Transcript_23896/g.66968 Transcript_23896/m.66968 type:complete len:219 (+) Transcript_23896:375-1031(+)